MIRRYDSEPKFKITDEEFGEMMDYLSKLLPLSRKQIIFNAVRRYYGKHKEKQDNSLPAMRNMILQEQGHECYYCHKYLSSRNATLDHKQPLARGGTPSKSNLCAACPLCNGKKGAMNEAEFKEFLKHELSPVVV